MEDKIPTNDKGQWHGYREMYWENDQLAHKGLFINGKQYGYHETYFSDGVLWYKGYYINGEPYGFFEHSNNVTYYAR